MVKGKGMGGVQQLKNRGDDYELNAALARIHSAMGSTNVKRLTKKQRKKLYHDEMKKTKAQKLQLLRELGLQDIRISSN